MFTHLDEFGRPVMVDVSGKNVTQREAEAECFVSLTPEILVAIKTGNVPKGDVFRVAELAGIMATKRVPEIIPLCHSIRLDHASVVCELDDTGKRVRVLCVVKSADVTGVEMEALMGAASACLTIYDMCKGIDKGMTIDGLKLLRKSGGKSGNYFAAEIAVQNLRTESLKRTPHVHVEAPQAHLPLAHAPHEIRAGVLTVSDKGAVGERVDTAGPGLALLLQKFGALVECVGVVPDEKEKISERLIEWADEKKLELILTTGGTGLSPRDVTPEALAAIGDRVVPGIGECMRIKSIAQTPHGILSRGVAVTRGGTLIIALPGSERGSRQCFEAVEPALRHAVEILNKWKAECGA